MNALRRDDAAGDASPALERRVLIVSPMGRDAELLCQVLKGAGIACESVASIADLVRELAAGEAVAIVAEESLGGGLAEALV